MRFFFRWFITLGLSALVMKSEIDKIEGYCLYLYLFFPHCEFRNLKLLAHKFPTFKETFGLHPLTKKLVQETGATETKILRN